MKKSQTKKILKRLMKGKSINPLQALEKYKCMRLAARIAELKRDGYEIDAEMVKTKKGKKYASYSLKLKQSA